MNSAALGLVMIEARAAATKETTLDGRLGAAMKSARNHWMVLDENIQFQGAVAAVWDLSDDETKGRIREEMDSLKALSALMTGVPVNMEAIAVPENPIGLMKRWRETTR